MGNKVCWKAALALLAAAGCAGASLPARARPAGRGGQTGMDVIAGQLAGQLRKHHVKKVAVARLTSKTGDTNYALSIWISEQLAAALASSDRKLEVIPRSALLAEGQRQHASSIDLGLIDVLALFAAEAGADAVVQGEFELSGQALELNLWASDLRHRRYDATAEGTVKEIPQVAELKDTPVRDPATGVYLPGVAGVSYPQCLRCPNPQFPKLECGKHPGFAILMAFTVTSDGRVTHMVVITGQGTANNKIAFDAVGSWRFRPSQLPDGTVVSSRMAGRLSCSAPPN
ncbi:MAG TPA: hypothetical protein VGS20_00625 [Candidatus Acidoferrales bacterium]|nr:hypothetical protein [Candidatus Acidoferrales bacterium]